MNPITKLRRFWMPAGNRDRDEAPDPGNDLSHPRQVGKNLGRLLLRGEAHHLGLKFNAKKH